MSDNSDISRRAMLASLGLTASAIYTIPAVTTLSAAHASSGPSSDDSSNSGPSSDDSSNSGPSSDDSTSGPSSDDSDDCSDNPSSPSCA